MGEPKTGEEFITHEYDEAIAVQQCIVDAETTLSTKHPVRSSQDRDQGRASREDKDFLATAQGARQAPRRDGQDRGRRRGPDEPHDETLETATSEGADSDFYEAHAVLLNIKRKQMDSAGGMLEIARATKDTELRTASTAFAKAQKASSSVQSGFGWRLRCPTLVIRQGFNPEARCLSPVHRGRDQAKGQPHG